MTYSPEHRPRIRPVEAFPMPAAEPGMFGLRDGRNLVPGVLIISGPVLFVLSLCDGAHTLRQIKVAFASQFGAVLPDEKLAEILDRAGEALLLDDDAFAGYYRKLVSDYAAAPVRSMRSADDLGVDGKIGNLFDELMTSFDGAADADGEGRLVGLVAPHLDYPRGGPCYGAAYGRLRRRAAPDRVVILGTNHFGCATSVVATAKDFETPLGRTAGDVAFIERLEKRCGPLREYEFDHAREHSVELQVLWCQHLFGAGRFKIVPVLCPDPCGPTGTRPFDGRGADLKLFAEALGECVREDAADTLVIAGADLSHVGAHFGDQRLLDDGFLPEVRARDTRALRALEKDGGEAFRLSVAEEGNPTRVCSAGCIFALKTALPGATARVLRYHQAVDTESQTGVTCAAVELVEHG